MHCHSAKSLSGARQHGDHIYYQKVYVQFLLLSIPSIYVIYMLVQGNVKLENSPNCVCGLKPQTLISGAGLAIVYGCSFRSCYVGSQCCLMYANTPDALI